MGYEVYQSIRLHYVLPMPKLMLMLMLMVMVENCEWKVRPGCLCCRMSMPSNESIVPLLMLQMDAIHEVESLNQ